MLLSNELGCNQSFYPARLLIAGSFIQTKPSTFSITAHSMEQQLDIHSFLYRRQSYYGQFKPEDLVFNANLQEFAVRISYIRNLQTNGKLSPQKAYEEIETLWKQLKSSYSALGIDPEAEENVER